MAPSEIKSACRPGKFGNAAHFTLKCGRRLQDGSYQKPLVALVFNLGGTTNEERQLLTQSEMETVFHEFGHALNSVLSRTEFQHMSGETITRVHQQVYTAAMTGFHIAHER